MRRSLHGIRRKVERLATVSERAARALSRADLVATLQAARGRVYEPMSVEEAMHLGRRLRAALREAGVIR